MQYASWYSIRRNFNVRDAYRLLVLLVLLCACGDRSPVEPPLEPPCPETPLPDLAFVRQTDSGPRLHTIFSDGSNLQLLGVVSDFVPAWSPDGRRIAFLQKNDSGTADLRVIDADGGHFLTLANAVSLNQSPSWSPDSRTLVFDLAGDIFTVDVDGNELRNLTQSAAADWGAVWSLNGARIAFWSNRTGVTQGYAMDTDGSNVVAFPGGFQANEHFLTAFQPALSPDWSRIAFWSRAEIDIPPYQERGFALFVAGTADSSEPVMGLWLGAAASRVQPIVWSPTGKYMASGYGGIPGDVVVIMSADVATHLLLTTEMLGEQTFPTWSSDGTRVAFAHSQVKNSPYPSGIYIMSAGGSGRLHLTAGEDRYPAWSRAGTP